MEGCTDACVRRLSTGGGLASAGDLTRFNEKPSQETCKTPSASDGKYGIKHTALDTAQSLELRLPMRTRALGLHG